MKVMAFQLKPDNSVNVIFKDLSFCEPTKNGRFDAMTYQQYLNQNNPTDLKYTLENDQFANVELWRLISFIKFAGISVADGINILKQADPNIGKRILDSWGLSQGLADETIHREVIAAVGATANPPATGATANPKA